MSVSYEPTPPAGGVPVCGEEEDRWPAVGPRAGPIAEDAHAARGGGGLPAQNAVPNPVRVLSPLPYQSTQNSIG